MTKAEKNKIIDQMLNLLVMLVNDDDSSEDDGRASCDMLTIKEAAGLVNGVSEHTIRRLVCQGKIRAVRIGTGKRDKILIPGS